MPVVKATIRMSKQLSGCAITARRSAFTLIDILVSLAVIAVLISILLPSMSMVRETTRRVVCASNARQHGLGIAMFTEDYKKAPSSRFEGAKDDPNAQPQSMILARTDDGEQAWDGLGILFDTGYLNAPQVFYCPSHRGTAPFRNFAKAWYEPMGKIVINYQYRGSDATVTSVGADRRSLVADGLRTVADYSHGVGSNVLRSDFSVQWVPDVGGVISKLLPSSEFEDSAALRVGDAWNRLDDAAKPFDALR